MRENTRFSDAIHVMALLSVRRDENLTSTQLAGSVNTNPVVIRRLIGDLKKAGLVNTTQGKAKIDLVKSPETTTLLEIYEAVDNSQLLNVDVNTNLNCRIGGNIQSVLENFYDEIAEQAKKQMAEKTLASIIDEILAEVARKAAQKEETS